MIRIDHSEARRVGTLCRTCGAQETSPLSFPALTDGAIDSRSFGPEEMPGCDYLTQLQPILIADLFLAVFQSFFWNRLTD